MGNKNLRCTSIVQFDVCQQYRRSVSLVRGSPDLNITDRPQLGVGVAKIFDKLEWLGQPGAVKKAKEAGLALLAIILFLAIFAILALLGYKTHQLFKLDQQLQKPQWMTRWNRHQILDEERCEEMREAREIRMLEQERHEGVISQKA